MKPQLGNALWDIAFKIWSHYMWFDGTKIEVVDHNDCCYRGGFAAGGNYAHH